MGIAKGIFIMDTHVYVQSGQLPGQPDGSGTLDALMYHMDRYDINMCILKATVGMSNQANADIVKKHPDRFIAICNDEMAQKRSQSGEKLWNIEDAVREIDEWMATGQFAGIGEGIARDRTTGKKLLPWDERFDQISKLFELGRKYRVPMVYHTGTPIAFRGHDNNRTRAHWETCDNGNPLLCHEVAEKYPDVPIILGHGGVEASGYFMEDYERCLNVAASHNNVFLETGMWWAELYDKPLKDPNIGAKKMVWGAAWGQRNNYQTWAPGCIPETYNQMLLENQANGMSRYLPDIWGWSLGQLGRLNIPQEDLNLILGGNAAWLYKVKTPLPYELMFKPVFRGFEW